VSLQSGNLSLQSKTNSKNGFSGQKMAGKLTPGKPSKENHRIFPQPVKPIIFSSIYGTTKVVP
jgi:hypothetical protein